MLTTQNWLNILKTTDPSLKVNKDPEAPLTDWARQWLDHETATAWASWVGNA